MVEYYVEVIDFHTSDNSDVLNIRDTRVRPLLEFLVSKSGSSLSPLPVAHLSINTRTSFCLRIDILLPGKTNAVRRA